MPCSRGDVLLLLFPNSDLRTAKRRPVLVVQANRLATELPQVIVAMISGNVARARHPSRVPINRTDKSFRESGLLTDSVVMTDNLVTVKEVSIHRKIGRFAGMAEVDAALRHTLAL